MLEALTFASLADTGPVGQVVFESSTSWVVPADVFFLHGVAVGKGGEASVSSVSSWAIRCGGGGSLSYRNGIPVTPGETLTINFASSYVALQRGGVVLLRANYANGPTGGTVYSLAGQVSFRGGNAGSLGTVTSVTRKVTGGAGAAGYAGPGADSPNAPTPPAPTESASAFIVTPGVAGTGGAGGSAISWSGREDGSLVSSGAGGGGVGLLGMGTNGSGGTTNDARRMAGFGGSGGAKGIEFWNPGYQGTGSYGGGADGNSTSPWSGKAGMRLMWGGGRAYPATKTGNL